MTLFYRRREHRFPALLRSNLRHSLASAVASCRAGVVKHAPLVNDHFTTVADWYHQGYLEFDGRLLGPKAEEFRKFIGLPALAGEELEIIININPNDTDIDEFQAHGWRLESPDQVRLPEMYRDVVVGSAAEFSCAKADTLELGAVGLAIARNVSWPRVGQWCCNRPGLKTCSRPAVVYSR